MPVKRNCVIDFRAESRKSLFGSFACLFLRYIAKGLYVSYAYFLTGDVKMAEIITMSSKGQIVVPKELREEMKIDEGTNFAIFGKEDTLILKKIEVPKANEVFEKVHKWGTELAKKKGWKEEDFIKKINKD